VPFGVDPKTVVCQFYKQGNCEKGKKCKFSHDLSVERKVEKINLYQDTREAEEDRKKEDGMEDWDEEKLRQVVMSKHGNPKTTTDKVCKYFIEAVENGKYGWFWTCPNGGDKCMYKHSLPPGYNIPFPFPLHQRRQCASYTDMYGNDRFVLKTKEQRAAEKALMDKSPLKTLTLEDFLESERHKLSGTLTPVTEESFAKWKKNRLDKKAAEDEARKAKEATGRAMFESGDWEASEDESDEEEEDVDDADEDEDENGAWNLEAMRRETERLRAKKEEDRLNAGPGVVDGVVDGGGGDGGEVEGEAIVNGVNGHDSDDS